MYIYKWSKQSTKKGSSRYIKNIPIEVKQTVEINQLKTTEIVL